MAAPSDEFVRRAKLLRVIDGDTLRVEIDQGFGGKLTHDIRLTSVDTPEARGVEAWAGRWVTEQVEKWIGSETDLLIHSKVFELGKFGRCLCDVWIGGRCLNEWLRDQGYAWRTDGGGKLLDVRSVENLFGVPESIKKKVREAML